MEAVGAVEMVGVERAGIGGEVGQWAQGSGHKRYRPPRPSCYPADPQELHGEEPEAFPETAGA